jgi:hypothetical protein
MARNKLTEGDKNLIQGAYRARFPAKATLTLVNRHRDQDKHLSLSTIHYQYQLLKAAGTPQLSHNELVKIVEKVSNETT